MKNKNRAQIVISLILIMSFCCLISSFGVGFAYHENYPLELPPGEAVKVKFNFQNPLGEEDINFKYNIVEGSEVLEIIESQEIYTIPVKGEIDIFAKISVSKDAKKGETYPIQVDFITVTETESGTFGLGASVGRKFNVIVIPPPEEVAELAPIEAPSNWTTYMIIGIVVILIVILIWYIIKKRKQKYTKPLPVV